MSDPYMHREQMRYQHPIASREFILNVLEKSRNPLRFSQLMKRLEVPKAQSLALKKRLLAMVRDQQIQQQESGAYISLKKKIQKLVGIIQRLKDGNVEIIQQDETVLPVLGADASILLGGDKVSYHKVVHYNKDHAVVGDIIHRQQEYLLGMMEQIGNNKQFSPLQRGLPRMRVIASHIEEEDLEKLVVRARIKHISGRMWHIELVDIVGHVMDPSIPEKVARHTSMMLHEMSSDVLEQLNQISHETAPHFFPDRLDWTQLPLVTIDGPHSRDFDDAVYARALDGGKLELYVAIADVAHYIPVGSPLDLYAFEQTTSVYFPKHCMPMLPEKLSNELCSLLPHVSRLALGVRIVIDASGKIVEGDVQRVVIQSHARLTYQEVEEMIQHVRPIPEWFEGSLDALRKATKTLQAAAAVRRALNIRSRQDNIVFDEGGLWESVDSRDGFFSHGLIEQMMVCANNFVALYLQQYGMDTIYRHHPPVRTEGYDSLLREVKYLGLDHGENVDLYDLNEFLRQHTSYQWLSTWVVRALSQARYEVKLSEHWGLSLDAYVHFTSPIRRYPDLMVHRGLAALIDGATQEALSPVTIEAAARRCSRLERKADTIVYDAIDWYQCQWAYKRIGQVFEGHMVTLLGFGIFVRLIHSGVEVMLPASHIESFGYSYDTINTRWTHPRLEPLMLGQKISIVITQVSFPLRRRDAEWADVVKDSAY